MFRFLGLVALVSACALPLLSGCGGSGDGLPDGGNDLGGDAMIDMNVPLPDLGPSTCGNGIVEALEECDDEDTDEADACRSDCTRTDPPDGAPIVAPPNAWTYVPIAGNICRDGSPTGIMINPSTASENVLLYFEGGGACFNTTTCPVNPNSFDPAGFSRSAGVFDRVNTANPVRDWSFVYFPFCTGDVHIGDAATMIGDELQQFRGYPNVRRALERIVPTFADARQVLLVGVSAGGFGAAANYEQVQRAFYRIPVVVVDDSGPPMSSQRIAPCLQDEWRQIWGFDQTILEECGVDCPNGDDYVMDVMGHVIKRYPSAVGTLISHQRDGVIRFFYGFGENDCSTFLNSVSGDEFAMGLEELRPFVDARTTTFGSYFLSGTSHTCLGGSCFFNSVVNGVALTDYVADMLDGTTSHVGPPL